LVFDNDDNLSEAMCAWYALAGLRQRIKLLSKRSWRVHSFRKRSGRLNIFEQKALVFKAVKYIIFMRLCEMAMKYSGFLLLTK